jgi:hypothetical protein
VGTEDGLACLAASRRSRQRFVVDVARRQSLGGPLDNLFHSLYRRSKFGNFLSAPSLLLCDVAFEAKAARSLQTNSTSWPTPSGVPFVISGALSDCESHHANRVRFRCVAMPLDRVSHCASNVDRHRVDLPLETTTARRVFISRLHPPPNRPHAPVHRPLRALVAVLLKNLDQSPH